ncbi:MAG: L-aspartate oxidase [Bdellovibrionales bacterium]|nr:L-aspartate oxidase [Bdellovibrionales bacterium]
MQTESRETLVIGSGLAGLFFALKTAETKPVTLITKVSLSATNTTWAQGGIAAAISSSDTPEKHAADTLVAGAGLCHEAVVAEVTRDAPERIDDLIKLGVQFDQTELKDALSLGKEGGHSERRILHISDHTGQSLHSHLLGLAQKNPNIELLEHRFAVELITETPFLSAPVCRGVKVLNSKSSKIEVIFANRVVLATGGAGKTYLYTSNWEGATGDGLALAFRAGARLANLELMQFHPTCLYHPQARNFLISEALRGEGGILRDSSGRDFVKDVHELGSLAPRDIVARAIDSEMKQTGANCVHLDMTHHSADYLEERFPQIYNRCQSLGIDISNEPIPVVPAAHYLCGGVVTNLSGQTSLENLFCLGESACTGLHGANRLASNSLLECLITSYRCAELIALNREPTIKTVAIEEPTQTLNDASRHDEMVVIDHMWDEIRRLMWNYVGIVRSNRRLLRAAHRLENIQQEISEFYSDFPHHSDIEELRSIATVAQLTVECALRRKESRGVHYSLDYPDSLESERHDTLIGGSAF